MAKLLNGWPTWGEAGTWEPPPRPAGDIDGTRSEDGRGASLSIVSHLLSSADLDVIATVMVVSGRGVLLCALAFSCFPAFISAGGQQETPEPTTAVPSTTPSALVTPEPTVSSTAAPSSSTTNTPTTLSSSAAPSSTTLSPTENVPATNSPSGNLASESPTSDLSSNPTSSPSVAPSNSPTNEQTMSTPTLAPSLSSPTNGVTSELGPTWGGCVDPNVQSSGIVTIGDPTTVCLTVGPGGDWGAGVNYLRWVFQPEADQYSRFHIPNSYSDLVRNAGSSPLGDRNLTVHTASQDFLSFLRVYYDPEQQRVFPYLTAIIDVDDGVVQGIAWDDACVFCSGGRCVENTFNFAGENAVNLDIDEQTKGCYLSLQECDQVLLETEQSDSPEGGYEATGGNTCDLTLYVVWTGTDNNGDSFQSSASRFGAFPESRLQDRVNNNLPDFNFF